MLFFFVAFVKNLKTKRTNRKLYFFRSLGKKVVTSDVDGKVERIRNILTDADDKKPKGKPKELDENKPPVEEIKTQTEDNQDDNKIKGQKNVWN